MGAGARKTISLFTGAGGLDYGFEAAGFATVAALDFDDDCIATLERNRPQWNPLKRDIQLRGTVDALLERGRVHRDDIAMVIGGPPCQPFSKSAYWSRGDTKRLQDPRAATLHGFLAAIEELAPQAFLLENVDALGYRGKDEGLRFLVDAIEEINRRKKTRYRAGHKVLNAVEHGVPQLRSRMFVVASRDGRSFEFPEPTHSEDSGLRLGRGKHPPRTAWDAIGHLAAGASNEDLRLRGKWADLLPSIPEGENYLWHTDRKGGLPLFGWRRRYWSFLLKLAKDKPAWTIQAQPGPATGPFHWDNRLLSMRELCLLQTFPADIDVIGDRLSMQRQVGNAVPALLAEVMAREIRRQFFDDELPAGLPALLPGTQVHRPPPRPPTPVPKKYLLLRGEHAAHPGTGKGYGAVIRGSANLERRKGIARLPRGA